MVNKSMQEWGNVGGVTWMSGQAPGLIYFIPRTRGIFSVVKPPEPTTLLGHQRLFGTRPGACFSPDHPIDPIRVLHLL